MSDNNLVLGLVTKRELCFPSAGAGAKITLSCNKLVLVLVTLKKKFGITVYYNESRTGYFAVKNKCCLYKHL